MYHMIISHYKSLEKKQITIYDGIRDAHRALRYL